MSYIIGLAVLGGLVAIGFSFFILSDGLKSVKMIKKNGVPVEAKIISLKEVKKRNKENAVYEFRDVIMCEFEYEGKHELELHYNYKLDLSKLKEGARISCIYDPKNNWLSTKDNVKSSGIFFLLPFVFIITIIILGSISEELYHKEIINIFGKMLSINDIILIIAFLVFEILAYKMFDKNYVKGKYIKLEGVVVDIHTEYKTGTGDSMGINIYAPEVSFKYNGKKHRKITGFWSNVSKYNIGQKVVVYYDPESDTTYARGKNTLAIAMMLLGLLFLIPIVKMFL